MLEILLAASAGVLTIGAPCILPMLPILLGASVGAQSRARPLFIALGFTLSFAAAALAFGALTHVLGLSASAFRDLGTALLLLFGLSMLWPRPFEALVARFGGGVLRRADAVGHRAGSGNAGGLVLGMTLGVIWTPCAGPVLGSILALVAGAEHLGWAAVLLAGYAAGAAVPMLCIGYGGQWVTTRVRRLAPYTAPLQRLFGGVIVAVALVTYFQLDTSVTAALLPFSDGAESEAAVGGNHGPAPELVGLGPWFNSAPLTLAALRGKVVLVDFWTYACVNCVRTLPHVTRWYDELAGEGLVIIGVHTPEFAFERDSDNVAAAIRRFGIRYPVAQDNEYATWNAWANRSWPAQYLIDRRGTIVLEHVGEGHYDEMRAAIVALLREDPYPGAPCRRESGDCSPHSTRFAARHPKRICLERGSPSRTAMRSIARGRRGESTALPDLSAAARPARRASD